MVNIKKQISFLFILIWLFSLIVTLYTLLSFTFIAGFISFFKITGEVIFSNVITCILLLIYSKELCFGYHSNSKKQNVLSLLFYGFLITAVLLLQYPFLFSLIGDFQMNPWEVSISVILIITTYLGLLINRMLKI